METLREQGISIKEWPSLTRPIVIAAFDGWGDALDISTGMATYLIQKLRAKLFAKLNPDAFYRYDESRPLVSIDNGSLKTLSTPGGSFYAAHTGSGKKDIIILKANEPSLRWFHFADEFFSLCERMGADTLITLGSMLDNVLHTDRIVSGLASSEELSQRLKQKNVALISYHGPSAVHSIIHSEGQKRKFECVSLWCHCPYYLQGTTHFGILAHLGSLIASLGEFELDTEDLEENWKMLDDQLQGLIENNPKLQAIIKEIRKAKVRVSWEGMKDSIKKDGKVISLKNFLEPK